MSKRTNRSSITTVESGHLPSFFKSGNWNIGTVFPNENCDCLCLICNTGGDFSWMVLNFDKFLDSWIRYSDCTELQEDEFIIRWVKLPNVVIDFVKSTLHVNYKD